MGSKAGEEQNNGFYIKKPLSYNINQYSWFWSSTKSYIDPWFDCVDFSEGGVNSFDKSSYSHCIRCVRSKE